MPTVHTFCSAIYLRQGIQRAGVQYILESVVKELAMDPTKKYIQVRHTQSWACATIASMSQHHDNATTRFSYTIKSSFFVHMRLYWVSLSFQRVCSDNVTWNNCLALKWISDWCSRCRMCPALRTCIIIHYDYVICTTHTIKTCLGI